MTPIAKKLIIATGALLVALVLPQPPTPRAEINQPLPFIAKHGRDRVPSRMVRSGSSTTITTPSWVFGT